MNATAATTVLLALAVVAPGTAGRARAAEPPADLVLRGGRFHPVSDGQPFEGSVAVRGGRIVGLTTDPAAEEWIGGETEVVELEGRTVTPGLIDAHSHLESLGAALVQVDLVGTASYREVVERVAAGAAATPAGEWVLGRGWDQNDWSDQAFPTHHELSRAVPDHPVWMTRIDGHAALLNARAMEALGIDATIVDPPGGRFHRHADSAPTGVLIDDAMSAVRGSIPRPSAEERRRRILAAARHCVERGLTTVTELGVGAESIAVYRELAAAGKLPLRVALFLDDDPALLDAWLASGPWADSSGRLTVRGIKLYADGALGSRGAALIEDYSDDPGNVGLLRTSGDHIHEVCRRALDAGFQVGVHAIGDRGALVALDAFERCFGGAPRPDARFRVEHAQVMRLEDIRRMARLGVIASMQPTHATSDMPWAEDRVGPARIAGAYAWRKVLDAGGWLALGSDFPVEAADPRLGLYAAVARQDLEGRPPGGWLPGERLSPAEALAGFTREAATSLFLEREVGSIEVGKRADLVVFGGDPLAAAPAELVTLPIDLTVVDGEIAFRREGSDGP